MEALLPHETLELTDDFRELTDGKFAVDTLSRQAVLQSYVPESRCVKYSDIKSLKGMELRDIFTAQQVVYIYHDQIDNAGENMEDEVFDACTKAVDEIAELIRKISGSADTYRFIVTSDHGYIYKRNPVTQSDKISTAEEPGKLKKRRSIVAKEPVIDDGIMNIGLGYMLGNDDSEVHIDMFNDRIEIYSPGGMPEGRRVQDLDLRNVSSRRRNPIIADMFNRLKYMDRRGSGFKIILDSYEFQEHYTEEMKPEFRSSNSEFWLILKNFCLPTL